MYMYKPIWPTTPTVHSDKIREEGGTKDVLPTNFIVSLQKNYIIIHVHVHSLQGCTFTCTLYIPNYTHTLYMYIVTECIYMT